MNKEKEVVEISSPQEVTEIDESKIIFPKGWLIFISILLVLIIGLSIAIIILPSA